MEKRSFEDDEFVEFVENNDTGTGKSESAPSELDKERDLPPELCHYQDEGCEMAESCLNCPFPRCIYEHPGGKQRWLKKGRDKTIARLYHNEGKNVKELSEIFGVTERTVQRALKAAGNGLRKP